MGYTVTPPAVVILPILLPLSANHSAPSGPATMPAPDDGTGYSVIAAAVVIRPIVAWEASVNHSAPSGPFVMKKGSSPKKPVNAYFVTTPAGLIRPIRAPCSANHNAPSDPSVIP